MKSIAELQQEIRSIRNEIIKLDARLEVLDSELLNYKDTPTENSEYKRIYERNFSNNSSNEIQYSR